MTKSSDVLLEHIQESIRYIERYIRGVTQEKFFADAQIQDAVIRRLEIVGEAVKNLPVTFKTRYPEVQWKGIAGLRDMLIHEYFGVDLLLLWNLLEKDLPIFKKQVASMRKDAR